MADAMISVLLDHLVLFVRKLGEEYVRLVMGVDDEVEKLRRNLQAIQAVLEDAEKRQLSEDSVRLWLEELKETTYDIRDVLDEWNTKVEPMQDSEITQKKVCFSFLFSCFASRQLSQVVVRYETGADIIKLNGKLQDIAIRKDMYNFRATRGVDELDQRPKTTSIVDVSEVRGRDEEKENLVRKLLSNRVSPDSRNLDIIPVVGMGGIGKTTLAQLTYNDHKVRAHFDLRIWVCVSDPFDVVRVARAIIEQVTGQASTLVELESLLQSILKSIKDKKFLLVLDDVWTDDYQKWEQLKQTLKHGAEGSRILVTTRKEEVAMMMGEPKHMIHLKNLSEEDSWLLFSQVAFLGREEEERELLEGIGRTIASKCKGLPLAAKTLGSFMRFKKTKQQWEDVLHNDIWELEEAKRNLFSPLLLSYYDLSPTVKRCFSYCAIFPKDELIDKDDLIQQWASQGYFGLTWNIERGQGLSQGLIYLIKIIDREIKGRECFDNLAMRSFFQDFIKDEDGNILKCKMHDIVHDFAQVLTRNEFSIAETKGVEGSLDTTRVQNARHLTLMLEPDAQIPISIFKRKNLHTLSVSASNVAVMGPDHFLHLTRLRTLNLSRCSIQQLPQNIGELVHLIYLNLSHNLVEELPSTIGNLWKLQTLRLEGCLLLKRLPDTIGNASLRHLYISGCPSLDRLPRGVGRLFYLRTMDVFINAHPTFGCCLDGLGGLTDLQRIYINGLDIASADEASAARLANKKDLLELSLDFRVQRDANIQRYGIIQKQGDVLNELAPHPNLETLRIIDYCGGITVCPGWMMTLINLRRLVIMNCYFCEALPPLGKLPSLEFLNVQNLDNFKIVGPEFLGIEMDGTGNALKESFTSFPRLKEVKFRCKEWWQWRGIPGWKPEDSPVIVMPRLHSLKFDECFRLEELPNYLQAVSLQNLIVKLCPKLQKCCQKETGREWPKICHIPNIQMS